MLPHFRVTLLISLTNHSKRSGRGGGRGLIPKHPVIHGPSRDHFGTYSDTVEFMAEAMNMSRYMVWNARCPLGLVVHVEEGEMPLAKKREPSSCFVKYRPACRQNWKTGNLEASARVTKKPRPAAQDWEEKTCQLTYEAISGTRWRSSADLRRWLL